MVALNVRYACHSLTRILSKTESSLRFSRGFLDRGISDTCHTVCNTAFPGSIKQNVHRDAGHIFPEIRSAVPPLLLVVNVALDDFTADNGATEIWPCSHLLVDADEEESATLKIPEERSKEHPSAPKTTMTAGSVIVRDMRTWHRGMPNKTGQPRTMLMLVFYRQYFIPDSFSLLLSEEELNQFSDKSK